MTKPGILSFGIGGAGLVCAALAPLARTRQAWLLAWTALSCFLVAWAYAANRPELFGKVEGRMDPVRQLVLLPYLVAFRVGCWIIARVRRLAPVDQVSPGLYVGGRIDARAIPHEVDLVIDLIAELPAPRDVRERAGYRCFPVLDGHHPRDLDAFLDLVVETAAAERPVLIHCESGVGRAPSAAAVLLVARGLVPDPESAVELMAKRRPRIHPTRSDWEFMRRAHARLRERNGDLG